MIKIDLSDLLRDLDESKLSGDPDQDKDYQMSRLPEHAILLTTFEDEIENWSTWIQESLYFVLHHIQQNDRVSLLIELKWDDNWGMWEWEILSHVVASSDIRQDGWEMIKAYAAMNLETAGQGEWANFLKELIDYKVSS